MENNKKNIAQIVAATISIMVVIGVIVLIVTQVGKNSNSTDKKAENNIVKEFFYFEVLLELSYY